MDHNARGHNSGGTVWNQATTAPRKSGLGRTAKIFIGLALGVALSTYINNVNPAWAEYGPSVSCFCG
jgi:hypothetical protein